MGRNRHRGVRRRKRVGTGALTRLSFDPAWSPWSVSLDRQKPRSRSGAASALPEPPRLNVDRKLDAEKQSPPKFNGKIVSFEFDANERACVARVEWSVLMKVGRKTLAKCTAVCTMGSGPQTRQLYACSPTMLRSQQHTPTSGPYLRA